MRVKQAPIPGHYGHSANCTVALWQPPGRVERNVERERREYEETERETRIRRAKSIGGAPGLAVPRRVMLRLAPEFFFFFFFFFFFLRVMMHAYQAMSDIQSEFVYLRKEWLTLELWIPGER